MPACLWQRPEQRSAIEDIVRALLLLSDGQFEAPQELAWAIEKRRRESNLRVHGLVIENAGSEAMAQLCDPLHVLRDWLT